MPRGVGSEAAFEELRARLIEIEKQTSIMNLLRNCVVKDDIETIQMALTRAKDVGLDVDGKWVDSCWLCESCSCDCAAGRADGSKD